MSPVFGLLAMAVRWIVHTLARPTCPPMKHEAAYITLSECIYRIAAATGEWPGFAKAKSAVMQATLDGKLTVYGNPRFLHQAEAIPAHAFSKPLFLPSLELLSLVKNPNPTRFGDWGSGKDDDKLGNQWRRLRVLEGQLSALLNDAA